MSMTLGSLFAGVGGFDLGFEQAGFKTVWQVEIDKAAQGVLRRRFPDAKLHSDVRQVGAHNLEPVDVLTFGSPCQNLSRGGDRTGLKGERSGLFHEAVRVIRELRAKYGKPDFAIWENVPGAFSSEGGADFAVVLQELADIGAADIAWRVLDSQGFGVPQRRRRIFLVADFAGERAAEVLAVSQGSAGSAAKNRAKKRRPVAQADGGTQADGCWWDGSDIADCLDLSMLVKGQMLPEKRRFPVVYGKGDVLRRMTPVEVERCFGFPDDWTATSDKPQADTARYRQLGNSIAVPVTKWLADRLLSVAGGGNWRPVVFSADCDDEGNCPACGIDYGDCECYGPTQDGLEYQERDGVLYARPVYFRTALVKERLHG